MKKWMILGALIGFLVSSVCGLAQDCAWPLVLWRASVVALASGVLTRWWSQICIQSLRKVAADRIAKNPPPAPKPFAFPFKN